MELAKKFIVVVLIYWLFKWGSIRRFNFGLDFIYEFCKTAAISFWNCKSRNLKANIFLLKPWQLRNYSVYTVVYIKITLKVLTLIGLERFWTKVVFNVNLIVKRIFFSKNYKKLRKYCIEMRIGGSVSFEHNFVICRFYCIGIFIFCLPQL